MIDILILTGSSASGKSTIEKILAEQYGVKKIVSYTTRAIRQGEVDGVDYHFISKEEFDKLDRENFFAESTFYSGSGQNYAIAIEDCVENSVAVVTPDGLEQLLQRDLNVMSFCIDAPTKVRKERMIERGDTIESIEKRLVEDLTVFKDVEEKCDCTITNDSRADLESITRFIFFMSKVI